MKRWLGIWLRPDLWALVSFLYRIVLESRCLLPEETFAGGEISAIEERVLQDALNITQRGNHVNTIVVEFPELSIMALRSSPEGVAVMDLVNNKLEPHRDNNSLFQQLVCF